MFLKTAVFVLVVLILCVFVTQVFVPLWRGTPLFPFFRRERVLESELKEARQASIEKKLEGEIEKVRETK